MPNCALVEHKGNHYLECKVEKTFEVNYFLENGAPIEKSAIEEFLPKKRESSTQDQLDKKIILRDIKLENILSMRFQGENIILDWASQKKKSFFPSRNRGFFCVQIEINNKLNRTK